MNLANFTTTIENLNYSAQALIAIFPSHFSNLADANNYARQPEKIANRIYANRMGNGDEASGDGWLHRGRGYIQITGKENQTAFLNSLNISPLNVELISDNYALESACWFWNSRKLNFVADLGAADSVVAQITKVINGGNIGLQDRILLFNKYLNLISNES